MEHTDQQKEMKGYLRIFFSLLILTIFSVLIHYLRLNFFLSVALILLAVLVQVFLSAGYFMHLVSEKKIIFIILILSFMLFLFLFLLILSGYFCNPEGASHVH